MTEASREELQHALRVYYYEIQRLRNEVQTLNRYVALLEGLLSGKNPVEYEALPADKRMH